MLAGNESVASQALNFGELLAGSVLITMGLTGSSVREVLAGKATHVKGFGANQSSPSASTAPSAFVEPSGSGVKGASPAAERFVRIAQSQQGVREGSLAQARFAAAAGISPAQAWCAAFITWALERVGIRPPNAPASVASWESWSGGERVSSLAQARPGDLLAFSGEHIGIYLGNGRMISGNWGNEVAIAPVSEENEPLSAIVRVKGLYTQLARSGGEAVLTSLGLKGGVRL